MAKFYQLSDDAQALSDSLYSAEASAGMQLFGPETLEAAGRLQGGETVIVSQKFIDTLVSIISLWDREQTGFDNRYALNDEQRALVARLLDE